MNFRYRLMQFMIGRYGMDKFFYGIAATAFIISFSAASPSTPMEFVSRFTEQEVTPGTAFTAFSTRALQAAQLMPVTLYCFIALIQSFKRSKASLNHLFIYTVRNSHIPWTAKSIPWHDEDIFCLCSFCKSICVVF